MLVWIAPGLPSTLAENYRFSPGVEPMPRKAGNKGSRGPAEKGVFRHPDGSTRAGLYARVSTADQQSLPDQLARLRDHAERRGWVVALEVADVASGASDRPHRDEMVRAALRRDLDVIIVAALDRWGRSVPDLMTTLPDLDAAKVQFVSLRESIDLSTAAGRAFLGMMSVFAAFERDLLRERVRDGVAARITAGLPHGRPRTLDAHADEARRLKAEGRSIAGIAHDLGISRDSVRRLLQSK